MVEREAAALGRVCYVAARSYMADALGSAILALPYHLQHAAFGPLLATRELPDLLDTLPAALHCVLLTAHAQYGSDDEFEADSDSDSDSRIGQSDEDVRVSNDTQEQEQCLVLRREHYTVSASTALFACIPQMPLLGAVVCRAMLPAADLVPALAAHSTLTGLDLAGHPGVKAELVVGALTSTLASWPRLASVRLGKYARTSTPATAAASDLLAPVLADATALTSLDVSGWPITPALAHAVGALTNLAQLHLKRSSRFQEAMPRLAALSRLRTFCGPSPEDQDQPACLNALHRIAACGSLQHLDLGDDGCPGYDLAGLELAMLPLLESVHLGVVYDSSLRQPGAAAQFDEHDPTCRGGVRALPHLLQLTSLLVAEFRSTNEAEFAVDAVFEARALGAALPLLTRLACLNLRNCVCVPSGYRALAAGWSCAPALCALTCTTHSDVTLLHGAHASVMQLRGLTSLDVTVERSDDGFEDYDGDMQRVPVPWLSGQVAQLSSLRTLRISSVGDLNYEPPLAVLPTLAALSAVTGLCRLELTNADLPDADWEAMPLCSLTALCLCYCHAPHAMSALAPRTNLRHLQLRGCGVQPSEVPAFMQQRQHALVGGPVPAPHLDLDLSGEFQPVTNAVLLKLLNAAELLNLWHVRVPSTLPQGAEWSKSAVDAVVAFNSRWGRQRKCTFC